ncbi:hypothetical protein FH972_027264 [Carpinus fangiana]|uniref:Uncharacterized protein n=1 Tax=Carpinus fangiana TaxID=176857 RepID=A0A5N6L6J5_9ROSI|nr:hypothetical protein FH972_027264 [Carpinus fangiana]
MSRTPVSCESTRITGRVDSATVPIGCEDGSNVGGGKELLDPLDVLSVTFLLILGLGVRSRARNSSEIVLRVVVVDPGGLGGLNLLLSRIGKVDNSADGGGFSGSQKRIIVDTVALKH